MHYYIFNTPAGPLRLVSNGNFLTQARWVDGRHDQRPLPEWKNDRDSILDHACDELSTYFEKREAVTFKTPLAPQGTDFETSVWDALQTIPYGETRSYGNVANAIGKPTAARAVGRANGRNPISIFIPCHRVIGSQGTLTGYAGGLDTKRMLLNVENPTLF